MAKKSADDLISSLTKDRILGVAEENGLKLVDQEGPDPGMSRDEAVADLISHVPADQGYYFKLYKRSPIPKEFGNNSLFLLDIPNPDLVQDLEVELLKLAKANGWTDGTYEFVLYRAGVPNIQASRKVTIQVPTTVVAAPDANRPVDPYASLNQALDIMKKLTPTAPTGPTADPTAVVKAVAEAYQAGASTAAKAAPAPDPSASIAQLVTAIKTLIPQPPPPADPLAVLVKMRELFPNTPAAAPAAPIDPFAMFQQMIVLMKELQPKPVEDHSTKVLEMVATLLPLMQPSGGDGEKPSIGVELIRAFAPKVDSMVSNVTDAIKAVAASRKGGPGPQPILPPMQPQAAPPEQERGETPVLPVFMAIQKAAENNDPAFYPQMDDLLAKVTTPAQYEGILDGQIPYQNLLAQISKFGGPFFTSPVAEAYFKGFLEWRTAQKAGEVTAKCPKCGIEWTFTTKEEFEKEGRCPDDQETLTLQTAQATTP